MADNGYNVLDTRAFDAFIAKRESIVNRYNEISNTYDDIVKSLLNNWVGKGAIAFRSDAKRVKANITGIYDILNMMCDTLTDCRQIFDECDRSLGNFNRNPDAE